MALLQTPIKHRRLYSIWKNMRTRCGNQNKDNYKYYGGRGINICEEWDMFIVFYDWAVNNGYADNLTIDRIDMNDNYYPQNCRWVTQQEQNKNRRSNFRIEYKGQVKILTIWANEFNINRRTLRQRISRGWSIEKALTQPVKGRC